MVGLLDRKSMIHSMRFWLARITIGLALLGMLFVTSCSEEQGGSKSSAVATQHYAVKGVVRELKPDGRTVVIRHEEIPGYMEAMTMPFRVRDTNELRGVVSGDIVSCRLNVTDDASWIDQVKRTGSSGAIEPPKPATSPKASTNQPGTFSWESIPEFALTNEFGQPVRLRDLKGRAVAMTFFFTLCPLPEYCPRLSKNFQGAQAKLKAMAGGPTNFLLVSVSFDPRDTPQVLRAYGRAYGYDSNHWSFITGKPEHIQELASGFGVNAKLEGGTYDHGFSTAIFDATGRLQNMWPIGGDLTDQIVGDLVKGAAAK
jgi:protein SCO1